MTAKAKSYVVCLKASETIVSCVCHLEKVNVHCVAKMLAHT